MLTLKLDGETISFKLKQVNWSAEEKETADKGQI